MEIKERVYSVLIVSSSEKFNQALLGLLPTSNYSPICFAGNVSAAKREMLEREFDFVFINTPLPDDFGIKFAVDLSHGKSTVALVFVRSEIYSEVYEKAVVHGVLTLPKPTSAQAMNQAFDWMCAIRERLRRQEKKTLSMEEKMEEIRLINRAKWLLIGELKMTESEAHRYLEKQAMDRCVTRREIAENIIKTYQ